MLEPVPKSYAALNVVYFDLQKGALHCIPWLKFAFSNVLPLFPQLASFCGKKGKNEVKNKKNIKNMEK